MANPVIVSQMAERTAPFIEWDWPSISILKKLIDCAKYAREIIQRDLSSHLLGSGRVCWEGA